MSVDGTAETYRFAYLKAANTFEGFSVLPGLPDVHRVYESEHLLPVFRNRLMPRRRPDYPDYLSRLALDVDTDPFEVLVRSEGWRATDRIEVFAHPERTPDGSLTTLFFVRGIRHLDGAPAAVDEVRAGDVLELEDEIRIDRWRRGRSVVIAFEATGRAARRARRRCRRRRDRHAVRW